MARIYPSSFEDFREAVVANCNPTTHMIVTDNATYIYVVPIVTSQHRHYIILQDVDEETIQKALEWLRKQGFRIIRGRVELQPA